MIVEGICILGIPDCTQPMEDATNLHDVIVKAAWKSMRGLPIKPVSTVHMSAKVDSFFFHHVSVVHAT